MRDAWGQAFSADTRNAVSRKSGVTQGTPWILERYLGSEGRTLVETLFLEGLSHGWYGGTDGQYAFANAPDSARLMWDFFASHPLSANQAPSVTLDASMVEDTCLTLTGSATDPDGEVDQVAVALDGAIAREAKAAELSGSSWSWQDCDLSDDSRYVPVVTVRDDLGAETTLRGAAVDIGTPPADQPPELALDSAEVDGRCIRLAGSAIDDMAGLEVQARIGEEWLKASLEGQDWQAERCSLAAGDYATGARAIDSATQISAVTGPELSVEVSYEQVVTSDLSTHVAAQRVRLYAGGFGAADENYNTLLAEHGVSGAFPLYLAAGAWYADPNSIPAGEPGGPGSGDCQETSASTYAHVNAGRAQLCGLLQACAVGSGDALGAWSTLNVVTLAETARGYYEAGACP